MWPAHPHRSGENGTVRATPGLPDPAPSGPVAERKAAWRALVRRTRSELVQTQGPAGRARQAELLASAGLGWVRRYAAATGRPNLTGLTVAAYRPIRTEPQVDALVESLVRAGMTVLLPLTLPAGALDWTRADDPAGRPLGPRALDGADVAFLPALAVDRSGLRLGQGGGYYDRALSVLAQPVPTIAVLHDHEVVPVLPGEGHDIRVGFTLTAAAGVDPVGTG